jgi:hypothetical protein
VRRALDSQALDYEAVSREAETLRSQLDAAQKDVARLNWMETLESESEESENAQPSIWISRRGVWNGDRLVAQWWEAQVGRSADCGGLSIREAIDAARVAAPREPK